MATCEKKSLLNRSWDSGITWKTLRNLWEITWKKRVFFTVICCEKKNHICITTPTMTTSSYQMDTKLLLFLLLLIHPVLSVVMTWGPWGSLSGCSKTCGFGTEERTRYVVVDGREDEEKKETQISQCYLTHCPVDGNWTLWSGWSVCTKNCGPDGVQKRVRLCSAPYPSYEGKDCTGPSSETKPCENEPCPQVPPDFDISVCKKENKSIFICNSETHCIPMTERCDKILHCNDGSDELRCWLKSQSASFMSWHLVQGFYLTLWPMLTALILAS
ncbi:brain-specific angiogenesis inhibitor 1-like [Octopus vulgaris]|uniref:Brain-specific angiogenesis inhibitor 1-like n=2 Tax=Octopus vulgaris TaxID=6645 RepID=A0AA36BTG3_OCTVU|nr:brain-specific angiogenesis inhibitor 1-like [Octopus vulgaris]